MMLMAGEVVSRDIEYQLSRDICLAADWFRSGKCRFSRVKTFM